MSSSSYKLAVAAALALPSVGCVVGKRPVELPQGNDESVVMLMSGRMPEPISEIARHGWFATKRKGSATWSRWEMWGHTGEKRKSPLADLNGAGGVMVHAVERGPEADAIIDCIERETPRWDDEHSYLPWPGPNSNTFIDTLLRRCGFHAALPASAIGRDHRGVAGASWTSEGTGFQLESPIVGTRLGLKEGVEIHVLALPLGVDLWPPAIIVPLGPGRIGFDN